MFLCFLPHPICIYRLLTLKASLTEDALPKHMIYIDGSIAQSVPEHPKRENIFSVSSSYGDAYLFQVWRIRDFYSFELNNLSYHFIIIMGQYSIFLLLFQRSMQNNFGKSFLNNFFFSCHTYPSCNV